MKFMFIPYFQILHWNFEMSGRCEQATLLLKLLTYSLTLSRILVYNSLGNVGQLSNLLVTPPTNKFVLLFFFQTFQNQSSFEPNMVLNTKCVLLNYVNLFLIPKQIKILIHDFISVSDKLLVLPAKKIIQISVENLIWFVMHKKRCKGFICKVVFAIKGGAVIIVALKYGFHLKYNCVHLS